jgi:putative transposase
MPTYARRQIVAEDRVGVYHCIARCVRRAFLCGIDPYTGQDFTHRKEWILDRVRELAGLFAVEEIAEHYRRQQ